MDCANINLKGALKAGNWQIVNEQTLAAAATSVTISGLDGDTDEEYLIYYRFIAGSGSNTTVRFYPNNDTTDANYGWQGLVGANSTASAVFANLAQLNNGSFVSGDTDFGRIRFFAKSGRVRTYLVDSFDKGASTTIGGAVTSGRMWNDTSNNVTSIVFTANQTNGLGIGSYFLILKKVSSPGSAYGYNSISTPMGKFKANTFETIAEATLGGNATSITISGLAGDTDVFYELEINVLNNANGDAFYLRPNNDSGANYGFQSLTASNGTAAASRSTAENGAVIGDSATAGDKVFIRCFMYAKAGFVRPIICRNAGGVTSNTVTRMYYMTNLWNDTSNQITSLVLFCNTANGFKTGTIYRLKTIKRST